MYKHWQSHCDENQVLAWFITSEMLHVVVVPIKGRFIQPITVFWAALSSPCLTGSMKNAELYIKLVYILIYHPTRSIHLMKWNERAFFSWIFGLISCSLVVKIKTLSKEAKLRQDNISQHFYLFFSANTGGDCILLIFQHWLSCNSTREREKKKLWLCCQLTVE